MDLSKREEDTFSIAQPTERKGLNTMNSEQQYVVIITHTSGNNGMWKTVDTSYPVNARGVEDIISFALNQLEVLSIKVSVSREYTVRKTLS